VLLDQPQTSDELDRAIKIIHSQELGCHRYSDNGDVVPRLASGTETVAEHEAQGSLEHRFIGLLKTGFLIKSQNFVGRSELLVRAREKAVNLRPVNGVRLEFFHSDL